MSQKHPLHPLFLLATGVSLLALAACGNRKPEPPPPIPTRVDAGFFPGRARIVWCRQVQNNGNDPFAYENNFVLMGKDSIDDAAPRMICSTIDNYRKPLMSPFGNEIIFTDLPEKTVKAIAWQGGSPRTLKTGMAMEVWRDGKGVTWVYYAPDFQMNQTRDGNSLRRFRLDQPATDESVWEQTAVTPDNFQISADGKMAAGLFPWNTGGLANLQEGRFQRTGTGCWTSLSPDNSYRMWIFDGAHRNLLLKPYGSAETVKIPVNSAPGCGSFEVYHPRWSNHVRYLAISGPYRADKKNAIPDGGKNIHIHVGRFNAEFTGLEAWQQITEGEEADFFPDVWVEDGEKSGVLTAAGSVAAPEPVSLDEAALARALQFRWMDQRNNDIYRPAEKSTTICGAEPFGRALAGRFREMDVRHDGWISTLDPSAWTAPIQAANAFTLVATLKAAGGLPDNRAGMIVSAMDHLESGNFLLGQYQGDLVFRLLTSERKFENGSDLVLARAPADRWTHVVISYGAGVLTAWINGEKTAAFTGIKGDLSGWKNLPLAFGAASNGLFNWPGTLEGIRLYATAIGSEQVRSLYEDDQKRWLDRTPAPRLRVKGSVVATGFRNTPESIKPYKRLLYEAEIKISGVLEGTAPEGRALILQRWGIMDGQILPGALKVGDEAVFVLEPLAAHPELEGERADELDDFELERYLEVE